MNVPTELEINPVPEDLDGQSAARNFLGKSVEDAELMFRELSNFHGEDLMFMGVIAFRYYIPAACRYLRSQLPDGYPNMFADFASTVQSRLEFEPEELKPVAAVLAETCADILARSTRFDEYDNLLHEMKTRPEFHAQLAQLDPDWMSLLPDLRTQLADLIVRLTELAQVPTD